MEDLVLIHPISESNPPRRDHANKAMPTIRLG